MFSSFYKGCLFFILAVVMVGYSMPLVSLYTGSVSANTLTGRGIPFDSNHLQLPIMEILPQPKERVIIHEEGFPVQLRYDGKWISFYSKPTTVRKLLLNLSIELAETDKMNFPLSHPLQKDDLIVIHRIRYQEYEKDFVIPYTVLMEENSLVEKGLKAIWQPGENGKLRKRFRNKIVDGELVQTQVLWKKTLKPPVKEIIALGTAQFSGPYLKKIRMCASSYNPTVAQCDSDPFTTATGRRVRFGIVAVDPKVIPLHTKLYVSGYGYAIAADTGGAIKNNKIDLFFWRRLPNSGWRGGYIDVFILSK
ncbi:MAG: 3D domain-containing protein [Caldisericia bacterium]|nr:3D domain-containing protein [Caldisericia bacterium]